MCFIMQYISKIFLFFLFRGDSRGTFENFRRGDIWKRFQVRGSRIFFYSRYQVGRRRREKRCWSGWGFESIQVIGFDYFCFIGIYGVRGLVQEIVLGIEFVYLLRLQNVSETFIQSFFIEEIFGEFIFFFLDRGFRVRGYMVIGFTFLGIMSLMSVIFIKSFIRFFGRRDILRSTFQGTSWRCFFGMCGFVGFGRFSRFVFRS